MQNAIEAAGLAALDDACSGCDGYILGSGCDGYILGSGQLGLHGRPSAQVHQVDDHEGADVDYTRTAIINASWGAHHRHPAVYVAGAIVTHLRGPRCCKRHMTAEVTMATFDTNKRPSFPIAQVSVEKKDVWPPVLFAIFRHFSISACVCLDWRCDGPGMHRANNFKHNRDVKGGRSFSRHCPELCHVQGSAHSIGWVPMQNWCGVSRLRYTTNQASHPCKKQ